MGWILGVMPCCATACHAMHCISMPSPGLAHVQVHAAATGAVPCRATSLPPAVLLTCVRACHDCRHLVAKLVARMEEVGIDDEMGAGELRITRVWESGNCTCQLARSCRMLSCLHSVMPL